MNVFLGRRAKALWQRQIEQLYKTVALAPAGLPKSQCSFLAGVLKAEDGKPYTTVITCEQRNKHLPNTSDAYAPELYTAQSSLQAINKTMQVIKTRQHHLKSLTVCPSRSAENCSFNNLHSFVNCL